MPWYCFSLVAELSEVGSEGRYFSLDLILQFLLLAEIIWKFKKNKIRVSKDCGVTIHFLLQIMG